MGANESVRRSLETKARELTAHLGKNSWNNSIEDVLNREIALATEDINRTRELTKTERKRLLKLECYVSTDIRRLIPQGRYYDDPNIDRRNSLKRRLLHIEHERRQLNIHEETQLQELHERLLTLLNRHTQVFGENGTRKNS